MQTQPARPLILIYGNSPHLQRVERTLRADPGLRMIQIDPEDGSAPQQLAALGAGVLIYDTAATDSALIQAIQMLYPAMATVGLDEAERSQTRLLGRAYPQTVMAGLEQVLRLLSPEKSGIPRA